MMAINNLPTSPGQPSAGQPSQLQLHDIHVPEQVSNFPIAPGWWLLLALIIIAAVLFYNRYKKNKDLNAHKVQALATLANNPEFSATDCISLLKCTAMQYFSRQQLARLYGDSFQNFLMNQLPVQYQENFNHLISVAFEKQYQTEQSLSTDVDNHCRQATKLWLTHALPLNKYQHIDQTPPVKKTVAINNEKELSA